MFIGAAAGTRSARQPEGAPAAIASAASLPGPLPSGAAPRSFEDLPADDERASGCHFADRGFGDYGEWRKLAVPSPSGPRAPWRVLVPAGRAVASDGLFRLLVHFHGAEPVRKQLAPEGLDLVIAALDAGTGSRAYDRALADADAWSRVIAAVEAEVATANHLPTARARAIVVSSWSAGYAAVAAILSRPAPRVDAVVLLDSLYAGYVDDRRGIDRTRVAPFLGVARAALEGGPTFVLTHTEIATPGYASTAEVATFVLDELGLPPSAVDGDGAYPMRRTAERGHVTIRGYGGSDRGAHCAQLHLLAGILRDTVLPYLP